MSEWKTVKMSDISMSIQPGPFGSQLHSSDYSSDGTPIIMPKDMIDGRIRHADLAFVSDMHVKRLSRHQVHPGNLIVARKGDVRKCVYITDYEDGWMTGSDCLKVALNEELCYPKFIFYQLRSPYIGRWLETISIGATMPSLNSGLLGSIELFLPPIDIQEHISSILTAYDSLIETNQRQIKLLEEAAQRLYKEWFVDLRYPGHENVPMVDGVPEGWKKNRADSFFEITIGKTPPRAEKQWFLPEGQGVPWASITDMGDAGSFIMHTAECLSCEAIERYNMKLVPSGTILVSFKLTVGRVSIVTMPMCTNEAIAHFRIEDPAMREYVFSYLKSFEYETLGNTSSISKAVNSKIIKAMPFVIPSADVLASYSNIASPIFDKICKLQITNYSLSEARDRLLPKLMSGEIAV